MTTYGKVQKIYELRTLGYDQLVKEQATITANWAKAAKAKRELNRVAGETARANGVESEAYKKVAKQLAELKIKEAELRVERQRLINEHKAQQAQRQAEITQREKGKQAIENERLAQEQLRTEREKAALQMKQEQLQRQQEQEQRRQQRLNNIAEAGSIGEIARQYRELYKLTKNRAAGSPINFEGQTLSYDEAIAKLKELAAAEQDFRRQFSKDGLLVGEYTSGIVQAFKKLGLDDLIGGQITRSRDRLTELNTSFESLRQELVQLQTTGQGSLESIEQRMIENRQEAINLQQQVGNLEREFRGIGDIGNQITTSISNGFRELRNQVGQLVLSYVGVQALISGLQEAVGTAKELADQTTSLEIELGKAAGGVDDLVESLGKLDTRTQLTDLKNIANVALRAGTAEQNLLSVTAAIDKTKIAFGKDFGDVEQGTETFAKLINIFYEDQEITGDRILKIGNSIRALANETVASVPFINDFAGRMAGLRQVTSITLPDVIGLGAGFEEFKQSAETSSTALVKIIPKLATDVEKYAQIVNMPIVQFRQLLNENPAEALIAVSEALVKSGEGIEGVASALGDAELGAGRVTTILGTLGGKADIFRARIARAKQTIAETTAIEDAFQKKNENLAATLDKISKKFADAAGSRTFLVTLTALSGVLLFLINIFPAIITLVTAWTAVWALANAQMIKARIITLAQTIALTAQSAATTVATIVTGAYNTTLLLFTGISTRAAAATGLLSLALRALPFGIILTILGILIASYRAFASSVNGTTEALKKQALQAKVINDVNDQINDGISKQVAALDSLRKILLSNTASIDTRKQALQEMIAIDNRFAGIVEGQIINLAKLDRAYKEVVESIKLKAQTEAAGNLAADKNKDILNIATIRQKIERELVLQENEPVKRIKGLTEEELKVVKDIDLTIPRNNNSVYGVDGQFTKLLDGLKKRETEATDIYLEYSSFLADKQQEINDKEAARFKKQQQNLTERAAQNKASVDELKKMVEDLDKQISALSTSETGERDKLKAQRDAYQKQIDDFLGTETPSKGSRLTGEQRDDQKEIDATRDEQLSSDKLRFAKGEIDEAQHLQNVLKINQAAIDKKLTLLKGSTAEEKRVIADLKLDRITQERETNEQLFTLRETALKDQLEQAKRNAELAEKEITDDPLATDTQKAQAKLDADKLILDSQVAFNNAMDALELQFSVKSKKNAEDRATSLREINTELSKDLLSVSKASITDLQKQSDTDIAAYKAAIEKQKTAILNSNLSYIQKGLLIEKLDKAEKVGVLAREVEAMNTQLPVYKKLLDEKKITEQEYNDFITKLYEKQQALFQATTDAQTSQIQGFAEAIKGVIAKLFGTADEITSTVYNALAGAFDLAKAAMNNFFDAERNRIQESKEAVLEKLDLEKAQVLARAQSKAEEERIEKQYDQKKKQAEKNAGNRLRDVKKKEAKIALATELANIAVAAAANPLNGVTFGTAGTIQFAIMSALALGRYALRLGEINNTQFEYGGVPTAGGRFGGKSHANGGTPFVYKGRTFEAEADELAVIRTKNAAPGNYTISGNHTQIASALNELGGGIRFAPGAAISKFEYGGKLGESLQAPVFIPSVSSVVPTNNSGQDKVLDLLTQQAQAIQAVNNRIDRIEVVQVTGTVTAAQKKQVKQTNIGTL